jgi:hypothetical protein
MLYFPPPCLSFSKHEDSHHFSITSTKLCQLHYCAVCMSVRNQLHNRRSKPADGPFHINYTFIFLWRWEAHRGPRPPHSRSFIEITHDTPQSVGLLWTRYQLVAETSTWQPITHITDRHPCSRWDSKPRSQQASGPRTTPYTARPLGPAY